MLFVGIAGIHGIEAFLQLSEQFIHFVGRGLSVIIQTYHIIAVRMAQSCHQRCMLSKVSGKADPPDIVILITQPAYYLHGIVRGTVIHQKNIVFILCCELLHFLPDLRNHMGQRVLRAIAGNYKTYFFHTRVLFLIFPIICGIHRRHPDNIPVFSVDADIVP